MRRLWELAVKYYSNRTKELSKELRALKMELIDRKTFGLFEIEVIDSIKKRIKIIECKREKALSRKRYFEKKI